MLSRTSSLVLLGLLGVSSGFAAEPLLRANDVVALVGGTDLAEASEEGYLETLLQRRFPQHRLKLRGLAVEGDTVFEQPRELNYPSLEQQLDEIGATVVVAQFGRMESLAGPDRLPDFIAAYEKLIERLRAGERRRVILMEPAPFTVPAGAEKSNVARHNEMAAAPYRAYTAGIRDLAQKLSLPILPAWSGQTESEFKKAALAADLPASPLDAPLRAAIQAKNRRWYHYSRPQNWAFLAGDRTEQPSSRDHLDPSKRWFPEEMKEWLPLVDAKEQEIWSLANKAAQP